MQEQDDLLVQGRRSRKHAVFPLFIASTAALYFELVIIRYLASEIRLFAFLKNMPLIASFFGIGLGMIVGRAQPKLRRNFPVLAALLFILTANAWFLHITDIPMPTMDNWQFTFTESPVSALTLAYLFVVLYFLGLVVGFFIVLGGIVGEYLGELPRLKAYGVNLLGSPAGIVLFTLLAFLYTPPWVWLTGRLSSPNPFFPVPLSLCSNLCPACSGGGRVTTKGDVVALLPDNRAGVSGAAKGWSRPSGYALSVDNDYFQRVLDLSRDFVRRNPDAEPNRSALAHYELPYRLLLHPPKDVLVVGAGTGNDVATALRNGVEHIDAVEIDPVILELGRRIHPEHPYDSTHVTIHNDDARAFFKKTRNSYGLIVFGYLDSHTLLSAYSSVRLIAVRIVN